MSDSINVLLQFITDTTDTQDERQAAMDALGDVQAKERNYRVAIAGLLANERPTANALFFAELTMNPDNEAAIRAKYRMAS